MDQCEDREEGAPASKSTLCGEHESQTKAQRNQPGPPPSSVSLQSDRSKDLPIYFKSQPVSAAERIHGRPAGPEPGPSSVSLQSDWSKDHPIDFKAQPVSAAERVEQQSSEVPSGQSAQQHQTQLDSIFMLLEDNIITFVKNELKKIQKALNPNKPQCLEFQREDEEQRRNSREAFVKITVDFLRRMKQEELADRLQRRKRIYLKI
ncbi:uncharacterized protein LOC143416085 [Maylandia zebra]|uniref:uncharacterized protein LOC143416085 n=1 Tax=Maylandia zebra TaxID=106582 RepID=UPI00403D2A78